MNEKPTKTREELAALVTAGLRSLPQCDQVTGLVIRRVVQIADDRPNWHAVFTIADNDAVPAIALQIVGDLAAQFDVA